MWVYLRGENGCVSHDLSIWLVTETVLLAKRPQADQDQGSLLLSQCPPHTCCKPILWSILTYPLLSLFLGETGAKPLFAGGVCYLHVLVILRQVSPLRVRRYASRSWVDFFSRKSVVSFGVQWMSDNDKKLGFIQHRMGILFVWIWQFLNLNRLLSFRYALHEAKNPVSECRPSFCHWHNIWSILQRRCMSMVARWSLFSRMHSRFAENSSEAATPLASW